jgi:hypothetical protein
LLRLFDGEKDGTDGGSKARRSKRSTVCATKDPLNAGGAPADLLKAADHAPAELLMLVWVGVAAVAMAVALLFDAGPTTEIGPIGMSGVTTLARAVMCMARVASRRGLGRVP